MPWQVRTAAAALYGLSIRPEHVHLKARAEDANRLAATVERVDFFGAQLVVRCRIDQANRVIAVPIRSDDPTPVNPDDRVELGISPLLCRVVADE